MKKIFIFSKIVIILILLFLLLCCNEEEIGKFDIIIDVADSVQNLNFEYSINKLSMLHEEEPDLKSCNLLLVMSYFSVKEYDTALHFIDLLITNASDNNSKVISLFKKAEILFFSDRIDLFMKCVNEINKIPVELLKKEEIHLYYIRKCKINIYSENWIGAENYLNEGKEIISDDYWNSFYSFILNVYNSSYSEALENLIELRSDKYANDTYIHFYSELVINKIVEKIEFSQKQKLMFILLLHQLSIDKELYRNMIFTEISSEEINLFYKTFEDELNEELKILLID